MPHHRRRNKSKEDGTASQVGASGKGNVASSSAASKKPSAGRKSSKSETDVADVESFVDDVKASLCPEEASRGLNLPSSLSESAAATELDEEAVGPRDEEDRVVSETADRLSALPGLSDGVNLTLTASTSAAAAHSVCSLESRNDSSAYSEAGGSFDDLGAAGRTPLSVVEEAEDCVFGSEEDWSHFDPSSKLNQIESESESESHVICCVPHGSCFVGRPLHLPADYADCVKVNCNNDNCTQSGYMHRVCFDAWEQHILNFLKGCGRARSWNDKQRQQNLWTKKGYDLAFRACDCLCGKGHLRKDLDFKPPAEKERKRHRRRKKSTASNTTLPDKSASSAGDAEKVSASSSFLGMAGSRNQGLLPNPVTGYSLQGIIEGVGGGPNIELNHRTSFHRLRTLSQSSAASLDTGVGSCSPPNTTPNNTPTTASAAFGGVTAILPNSPALSSTSIQNKMQSINQSPPGLQPAKQLPIGSPPQLNPLPFASSSAGAIPRRRINSNPYATNPRTAPLAAPPPHSWTPQTPAALFSSVAHHQNLQHPEPKICPATGNMFQRRKDLSVFHTLPYQKRNPYHVKIDDEGPHGNDDMRNLILASLSIPKVVRVPCGLCGLYLLIYDRFPLIDGTFYLSPVQHRREFVPINHHQCGSGGGNSGGGNGSGSAGDFPGKTSHYLSAVCMSCLEGDNDVRCKFCLRRWDGSWHVLGTMYSFDIFAAAPCCAPRVACNACRQPLVDAAKRLQFFSDYSRPVECQHCGALDFHFVKPLSSYQLIRKN